MRNPRDYGMNCNEAKLILPAYGDGELDACKARRWRSTSSAVRTCSAQRDALAALRPRIRSEMPYYSAPEITAGAHPDQLASVPERRRPRAPDP